MALETQWDGMECEGMVITLLLVCTIIINTDTTDFNRNISLKYL